MISKRILSISIVILLLGLITYSCRKNDEPAVYKDPGLIWANPEDITEGTVLSATSQLNARADIEGIFIYTPPVGAQLGIGNDQELKVDFYPTVAGYRYATKTVMINVLPSLKPTNGLTTAVFNSSKTYGTMTDQDGNVYKTITIGTQTWMAENLRTTKFRDGSDIPNICYGIWSYGTGAYCSYNGNTDPVFIATYGRLYNWYIITNPHNLAPAGWHVPSDADWTTLINELGGESVAGDKMKEAGTTHWSAPNASATNESGFTGLPGGMRPANGPDPFFNFFGVCGYYWSSTEPGPNYAVAYHFWLTSNNASVYHYDVFKAEGYSIRLVKD